MMFVVEPVFTGVAIIILLLLLMSLHYLAPMASWGSISQALIFHQVRKYLLLLDSRKDHVKYWRPQILLLVNNPKTCCPLIDFVNDLKKSGLYVLGHVKLGRFSDYPLDPTLEDQPYWLGLVDYLRVKAFVELTVAESLREGIQHLVRISGIGAMKPNTIILGFFDKDGQQQAALDTFEKANLLNNIKYARLQKEDIEDWFREESETAVAAGPASKLSLTDYVHVIQDCLRMHKNVCIARNFGQLDKMGIFAGREKAYVDVWPVDMARPGSVSWGFDNSCLFLLQLGCILNMVAKWKSRVTLRVFLCITSLQDVKHRDNQLRQMLQELRIHAKTIMVPWDHVICHLPDTSPPNQTKNQSGGGGGVALGESAGSPPGSQGSGGSGRPMDFSATPDRYVQAMNETIRRHTERRSAAVFINMPLPPADEAQYGAYMANLDTLTSGLPPVMLVHGISSVISTAL